MQSYEELNILADRLSMVVQESETDGFRKPLDALQNAIDVAARSFSGSWLGYHARVYYNDLKAPPPSARFSQEWGLMQTYFGPGSPGDWREYDPHDIREYITQLAGGPDLKKPRELAKEAEDVFGDCKSDALSIIEHELSRRQDKFLENNKTELEKLEPATLDRIVAYFRPSMHVFTRDTAALGQGVEVPAHIDLATTIMRIHDPFRLCKSAAAIIKRVASHLERTYRRKVSEARVGTNVFIGHGRSHVWRELKDFVQDRLRLPWDEFNRVPVAGITNIARLSEMLDAAAIAFLIMTAEDEMADGGIQARMNVVHEAGLFQGRLGFTKAIVILEEGCAEFSNIVGLGQIRFSKGRISAAFEDIRAVVEREGLLDDSQ